MKKILLTIALLGMMAVGFNARGAASITTKPFFLIRLLGGVRPEAFMIEGYEALSIRDMHHWLSVKLGKVGKHREEVIVFNRPEGEIPNLDKNYDWTDPRLDFCARIIRGGVDL